jgi:hypothetical protein
MLPNFLIIGAAKAASTWLSDCLGDHPEVFMAEIKEVRFFTRHFDKGLAWYTSHFSGASGKRAIGEATPGYLGSVQAPARIRSTLGNVKMIASLRHPVDRAYSHYWHYVSQGDLPLHSDFLSLYRQGRFRDAGNYFARLSHYLEYFPRENFLILIYEDDIQPDPRRAIANCLDFIGVNSSIIPAAADARSNQAREIRAFHNQAWTLRRATDALPGFVRRPIKTIGKRLFGLAPKKQTGYARLADEVRQELLADYMPDIRQLEDLLRRDLSIWYAPRAQSAKRSHLQ